jgi:glycosyltransferase involved in cell wall biosynthesis
VAEIFCTTIIPTVGRASLARAVESVLAQSLPEGTFEIVVVNDSGRPLPPAAWQADGRVTIVGTNGRQQIVARNTGAALAKGRYLHFLDDDDWMTPGAFARFWQMAAENGEAGCLCGAFELVDENGRKLARHAPPASGNCAVQLVSGVWLQVAAVFIRADCFFDAGGFSPLFRISEEIDLFDRLALRDDFVTVDEAAAQVLRGAGWQTAVDYSTVYESNRRARDRVLRERGAFSRLRASADSAYWHGRLFRLYVTSMVWHWRRRRFFTGLSRGLFALRSLLPAGGRLLDGAFWQGAGDDTPRER